jgi:regulator of sirC expression with transglutaminase-like and TPR domain
MTVAEKLMVVNAMIFRIEKFRPGGKLMKTPGEFLLNLLFDKRRGGPFSLGMLYKIVCDKLGIPLEVVILPEYFVLRSNINNTEFFIDVFQKGDFFVREDLANFLRELRMNDQEPEVLRVVEPEQILLEMINGLMKAFAYQKEEDRVEALKELVELLQDA